MFLFVSGECNRVNFIVGERNRVESVGFRIVLFLSWFKYRLGVLVWSVIELFI